MTPILYNKLFVYEAGLNYRKKYGRIYINMLTIVICQ